ncbi:hypothetical protein [Mesorhizobium sp. KR1-2]|uniref:hypothetical protein n=1 Tax=Mesorhizobium sp. KR1-2 TaxID=3156609 RepID=UPI0032B506E7
MPTGHQYLTSDDLAMIQRVLAKAGFCTSKTAPGIDREAARYLMRQFQDGLTDEAELTRALDHHLAERQKWQSTRNGPVPLRSAHRSS